MTKYSRILIISASGIGNTILFTPALRELKRQLPGARIDLLVYRRVFGDCVKNTDLVDNIYVIPDSPFGIAKLILSVRRRRYDLSITAFPSNRWQFNLFAFLLGAGKRLTHSYDVGRLRTLSFLQNMKVHAEPGIHDVYQNLNLLKPLGLDAEVEEAKLLFGLSKEDIEFADNFFREHGAHDGTFILGVHPGAGPIGSKKKWGLDNFAREIDSITRDKPDAFVLLFGGPEETAEREELRRMLKTDRAVIFQGTLEETASLISRCSYFFSNDTGLMHIAAAFGIPQKAVFISTSISRTRPFNEIADVLDLTHGSPEFSYPFRSTHP